VTKPLQRSIRHWTGSYVLSRTRSIIRHWIDRDLPHITQDALRIIEARIGASDRGIEWGSGSSTVWLAARCGHLISVEHDRTWFEKIHNRLKSKGLAEKVDYRLSEWSPVTRLPASYVGVAEEIEDHSLNFCFIDGRKRDECALASLRVLKPGGLLILDDAHRYIPRDRPSRAPGARRTEQGFPTPYWADVVKALAGWSVHWTSDEVSDTLVAVKPDG
jgi:hypothetical protein